MRFFASVFVCAVSFSAVALTQVEAAALRRSLAEGDDVALSAQLEDVLRRGRRPVQVSRPDFEELLIDLEAHLRTDIGRSIRGVGNARVPEFSRPIAHRLQVAAALSLWSRKAAPARRWPAEHLSRVLAAYAMSFRRGRALDRQTVRTLVYAAAALPELEQDLLGFLRFVVADSRWPNAVRSVALQRLARAEQQKAGDGLSPRAFRGDSPWENSARAFYRSLAVFATSSIAKEAAAGRAALEAAARYFFPSQFPSINESHTIYDAFQLFRATWLAEVRLAEMNAAQLCAVVLATRRRR